jgi:hypothetical protein
MYLIHRVRRVLLASSEAGQTTAEYALVILGVAVVAGGLAIWAKGGAIKDLFDDIIGKIL